MMTAPNYRDLGKRRILVAEDVEINQYLARHMMEAWGFEVDIAVNGREAVVLVQQNTYDLVLMDIHMPEMDGMEATRQIRRLTDAAKARIPIVALTANALKGDRERFLAAGMNDYLPKPFNDSNLYRIIANNLTNMSTPQSASYHEVMPPDSGSTDKLYDLSLVHGIAGGDEEFVKRMLRLFLDTLPGSLQDLQKETASQNWEAVGKLAHKLKSTIDSMGIGSLKEVIRVIEQNGKKAVETDQLPGQVNQVETILRSCAVQIKKDFAL
jgi:hypothetical protein